MYSCGLERCYLGIIENTLSELVKMGGSLSKLISFVGPCISQNNYEVRKILFKFYDPIKGKFKIFIEKNDNFFNFDLRGYILIRNLQDLSVFKIENIAVDSFASKNEYFSHRRAKKLGEDDYGRCISAIKKINL